MDVTTESQPQAADGEAAAEGDFNLDNLMNNVAAGLSAVLRPKGCNFFVMVVTPPNAEGNCDLNTVSSIPAETLPSVLRAQADSTEAHVNAKAAGPGDIKAAVRAAEGAPPIS